MQTFVETGKTITLPAAAAAYTGGLGYLIGNDLFGVAIATTAIGDDATFEVVGVFSFPKASSVTPSAGDAAYWDNSGKVMTNSTTGHTLVGRFWNTALSGDATVNVKITPLN